MLLTHYKRLLVSHYILSISPHISFLTLYITCILELN